MPPRPPREPARARPCRVQLLVTVRPVGALRSRQCPHVLLHACCVRERGYFLAAAPSAHCASVNRPAPVAIISECCTRSSSQSGA
eukprot:3288535-Pleurochrysis_carterae.AAC.2